MLTNLITEQLDLPHEEGAWIKVRKPSALVLREARSVAHAAWKESLADYSSVDPALLAKIVETRVQDTNGNGKEPEPVDPLTGYDDMTLVRACVIEWSYDVPVTPDTIAELDEETILFVARSLVPKADEADRKNGSARSTGRSKA